MYWHWHMPLCIRQVHQRTVVVGGVDMPKHIQLLKLPHDVKSDSHLGILYSCRPKASLHELAPQVNTFATATEIELDVMYTIYVNHSEHGQGGLQVLAHCAVVVANTNNKA
jgi:hypothetical protein